MAAPTIAAGAPAHHKPWYKHLYAQVLCAIVLGVLLGHFYPSHRRADEAARRRIHQADQDADRADHLLHGRPRHRQHGGHEEGRPGRLQGPALFRGHDHDRPDHRPDHRQSLAARRRHERRPDDLGHQGDRHLHRQGRRAEHRRVPAAHHPGHRGRRLRRGRDPAGAVLRDPVRLRAALAGREGQAAARHHRPDGARVLRHRRHRDEGRADRRFRRHGVHHRQVRRRHALVAWLADAGLLRHLPDLRLRRAWAWSAGCAASPSSSSSATSRRSC